MYRLLSKSTDQAAKKQKLETHQHYHSSLLLGVILVWYRGEQMVDLRCGLTKVLRKCQTYMQKTI